MYDSRYVHLCDQSLTHAHIYSEIVYSSNQLDAQKYPVLTRSRNLSMLKLAQHTNHEDMVAYNTALHMITIKHAAVNV